MAGTTIHHQSQWPRGLIGPVDLLWRGQSPSALDFGRNECRVWLRFHPAMSEETWKALTDSPDWCAELDEGVQGYVRLDSDLRGEIRSFEMNGPKAGLVLQGITSVCKSESNSKHKVSKAFFCHASPSPRLMDPNRLVLEGA